MKSASLVNENFVVLIPGGSVLSASMKLQELIKSNINIKDERLFPEIHITIDRIKKERTKEAIEIIEKITNEFPKISIALNDFSCYHLSQDKFLVLNINKTNSLSKYAKKIHQELYMKNITTINNYDEWNFHITILSNLFSRRSISDKVFKDLCKLFSDLASPCVADIDRVDIWKPTLKPDKKLIYSYLWEE